jgi:hypothetical protein
MKLIIRQYVAGLKERNELDAVLPDLLSQMGMVVYSRPGRGTRQDGVDVAAVGSLNGGPEKIYLFSIKAGDLSRKEWDGDSVQSLRPSLNEIIDSYIPNRIPSEHKDKDVVICVTFGGDVQEQVRPQLVGFIAQNTKGKVSFEEWNGDKLASLIQSNFLREDLIPDSVRSNLRKTLALLDEPEAAYGYFAALVDSLDDTFANDAERIRAIRQLSVCLWILFSWSRELGNIECAYRASEVTLLHAWNIFRYFGGKDTKTSQACEDALASIFQAYRQISGEYLAKMTPHLQGLHALSAAVQGGSLLDVNLKMFDLLGRFAIGGLWSYGAALLCAEGDDARRSLLFAEAAGAAAGVKALISNNPVLYSPIKDDQATDIALAAFLLLIRGDDRSDLSTWLREMIQRIRFAFAANERYPCTKQSYSDLLEHPVGKEAKYRESVTNASVLYPLMAVIAAVLKDDKLFAALTSLQSKTLTYSNFQLWFPDDAAEDNLYTNRELHGISLCDISLQGGPEELLKQLSAECDQSPQFGKLSCAQQGWWQLVLVACRHYRLPIPVHLLKSFGEATGCGEANSNAGAE